MFYKKMTPFFFSACLFVGTAKTQTLFSYANKTVTKSEFLHAYNKNPDSSGNRAERLNEYLDMYINFKLKIQAAYDEKLNETAEYKAESENFKSQLTENNINAQANINQLIHEAFVRSQKDIQLSQVFVEVKPGEDTMQAYLQIQQAFEQIKNGKDFGDVSQTHSSDAATQSVKGNLGYITVFSLPYKIENIVYALRPGMYSNIYRSSIGYHIFKNVSERVAVGKRKIQQILVHVPSSFTDEKKIAAAHEADSIYALLKAGHSFDEIQQQILPNSERSVEMGIGDFSSDFESQVYALQKPGDISSPFVTAYGYHIIKLAEILPVSTDESDVVATAALQQIVLTDKRLEDIKGALIQKWMVETKYNAAEYNADDLWKYTDSATDDNLPKSFKNITPGTILFSFAKSKITVTNWINFLSSSNEDQSSPGDYATRMNRFINESVGSYYRGHIEEYYPAMVQQLHEFNEANLLFAVMDKHVWGYAVTDTIGLKNYYNTHSEKYFWLPGMSALVVASPTRQLADEIAGKIKANPADWQNIIATYGTLVNADSSRFENSQLPVSQQIIPAPNFQTNVEKSEGGDAYTFVHIFNVFSQPAPRNFDDARGMVMNDYQQVLEEKWVASLKKKYPVTVDEVVKKGL